MSKELTRAQKLKKYEAPTEILVSEEVIMYAGEEYDDVEKLISKLRFEWDHYVGKTKKKLVLADTDDYYDNYYNLVLVVTRPLTTEEEDAIIAKGDKKAEGKEKSFAKAKADYEKALAKKYPNYKLPNPE